jgi:hypothetical protein
MKNVLKINDIEYEVCAVYSYPEKAIRQDNALGIKLQISVMEVATGRVLKWQEMKDSYLAEKICNFAENCFNGQRSIYWRNE